MPSPGCTAGPAELAGHSVSLSARAGERREDVMNYEITALELNE